MSPAAIQKLQSLFEDIFEEADSFTANPTAEEVDSSSFFEGLAADGVHPVLATKTIEKIILYTARVQDTRKRQRKTEAGAIPWDVDSLLRLFCMLERNMRDAEGVNPFPDNGRKAVVNPSPKKGGKKGGKKGAGGPSMDTPELEMTAEEQDTGDSALEVMKVASTAAFCILAILSYRTTPKQLYSEDLLSLAVTTIRNQMTNIIFPVVEALAGERKLRLPIVADLFRT
jgi:cohesin loading factor subunit SCC2